VTPERVVRAAQAAFIVGGVVALFEGPAWLILTALIGAAALAVLAFVLVRMNRRRL
jgi:hypothetical protein